MHQSDALGHQNPRTNQPFFKTLWSALFQDPLAKCFGNLHRIQCSAFAQVITDAPQVETVLDCAVLPDTADKRGKIPNTFCRRNIASARKDCSSPPEMPSSCYVIFLAHLGRFQNAVYSSESAKIAQIPCLRKQLYSVQCFHRYLSR